MLGEPVILGIRPEHVAAASDASQTVTLKIRAVEPLGPHTLLIGTVGPVAFTAQMPASTRAEPDQLAPVPLDLDKMHLFRKDTGEVVPVA